LAAGWDVIEDKGMAISIVEAMQFLTKQILFSNELTLSPAPKQC